MAAYGVVLLSVTASLFLRWPPAGQPGRSRSHLPPWSRCAGKRIEIAEGKRPSKSRLAHEWTADKVVEQEGS
jgi:hypothetical protein